MIRHRDLACAHAHAYGDRAAKKAAPARRRIGAWRARLLRAWATVVLALAIGGAPAIAAEEESTFKKPGWDQVANIKEAALHLANMQRTQGANRAFQFIDACYRTHSLQVEYTRAFEACIAQDYLETRILALIYSRMPPETLKRMGMPTPQMLADTMGKRVVTAFRSYKVPVSEVQAFKKLVDEHGFPVFFRALFPNTKVPEIDDEAPPGTPGEKAPPKDGKAQDDDAPKNGEKQ